MKKICLSLVLTAVSVFSISAQTINNFAAVKTPDNVKLEAVKDETKPVAAVQTIDKTSKPEFAVERKAGRGADDKDNPGLTSLDAKDDSLGRLSTGDAAIDDYIEIFGEIYDVDKRLIYAQMSQESSFKPKARSGKGASGYMQLMPDTARRFGVTNIYNPKQNIKAGIKYMRWLLDKFGGDKRLALAGYNAGEGSVMKYGNKVPPYRETQNYVAKIMNHYELISSQDATVAENEE
jgi:soluble lytic murein transglycosylase-like protein